MKSPFLPAWGLAVLSFVATAATAQPTTSQSTTPTIAAGVIHSASIHADGTLWAWGANLDGQLGDGTTTGHTQPAQVLLPGSPNATDAANTHWAQVVTGTAHTLALTTTGELYAWGANADGQLGTADNANHLVPMRVAPPVGDPGIRWAQVVAGTSHTLAVSTDGRLFAWGSNKNGQLGIGIAASQSHPVPVFLPIGVVGHCAQIAAGNAHSLALTTEGQLFAWGDNDHGQLGDGSFSRSMMPTAVLTPAGHPQPWQQIAAGRYHTLALTADGKLFAWGSNKGGQLGPSIADNITRPRPVNLPTALKNTVWTQVAGGAAHTIALTADGRAYTWGNNVAGQLGSGSTRASRGPVAIALPASCASRCTQVAAGSFHTLAQSANGTLCTWGTNGYGQLGDGGTDQQATPACRTGADGLMGSTQTID